MSDGFIKFLVRKTLWEGRIFQVVKLADHLEDRVAVDPATLAIVGARLAKFSEHEGRQDVALVAIELRDSEGERYVGHLNAEFDKLLTEYGQGLVFTAEELAPPAREAH